MDKKTKRIIQITTAGVLVAGGVVALILLLKNCSSSPKQDKRIEIGNINNLDLKLNEAIEPFAFSVKYKDGSYIEKPEFSISPSLPLGLNFDEGQGKISGTPISEADEQGNFKTYKLTVNDGKGETAEKDFHL
ncbi:MAG: Ig domain-containing protein, partial [Mycoplasmataceae bacterium]|nr:Ig domain-containing protein [Mycoplasmataceae bacterium]